MNHAYFLGWNLPFGIFSWEKLQKAYFSLRHFGRCFVLVFPPFACPRFRKFPKFRCVFPKVVVRIPWQVFSTSSFSNWVITDKNVTNVDVNVCIYDDFVNSRRNFPTLKTKFQIFVIYRCCGSGLIRSGTWYKHCIGNFMRVQGYVNFWRTPRMFSN